MLSSCQPFVCAAPRSTDEWLTDCDPSREEFSFSFQLSSPPRLQATLGYVLGREFQWDARNSRTTSSAPALKRGEGRTLCLWSTRLMKMSGAARLSGFLGASLSSYMDRPVFFGCSAQGRGPRALLA